MQTLEINALIAFMCKIFMWKLSYYFIRTVTDDSRILTWIIEHARAEHSDILRMSLIAFSDNVTSTAGLKSRICSNYSRLTKRKRICEVLVHIVANSSFESPDLSRDFGWNSSESTAVLSTVKLLQLAKIVGHERKSRIHDLRLQLVARQTHGL